MVLKSCNDVICSFLMRLGWLHSRNALDSGLERLQRRDDDQRSQVMRTRTLVAQHNADDVQVHFMFILEVRVYIRRLT